MKVNTEWGKLLQKANASRADTIPKGFRPMDDWLKEFQIAETTWRRTIPILEESGQMVRGYYRIIEDHSGRVVKKPFWKREK